jgi:hypothetical protein
MAPLNPFEKKKKGPEWDLISGLRCAIGGVAEIQTGRAQIIVIL